MLTERDYYRVNAKKINKNKLPKNQHSFFWFFWFFCLLGSYFLCNLGWQVGMVFLCGVPVIILQLLKWYIRKKKNNVKNYDPRLDEVLKKINQQGLDSLNEEEKYFLEKESKRLS